MKHRGLHANASRCIAVVLASYMVAACGPDRAPPPDVRPVEAVAVEGKSALPESSLPAVIQARHSTPLSFRVGGRIVERRARIGDHVEAGQVVARLDRADIDKPRGIASAQPGAARRQAELASNQLRYATLSAEHAGVIAAEWAGAGQSISAKQPIYTLAWDGERDVVCDVPESALESFIVGARMSVRLAAHPHRDYTARVRELAPAGNEGNRTWRAKLTLDASESDMFIGMTVSVVFSSGRSTRKTFTIPSAALFAADGQPAVWVVSRSNESLESRHVEIVAYGERTVTLTGGISEGDRVVWQGAHTFSAGEKVRVVAPIHPEDFVP